VSASEKLRELGKTMDGPQTYGPEPIEASAAADRLVNALPQIVAVVEALEAIRDDPYPGAAGGPKALARVTLVALEEALNDNS